MKQIGLIQVGLGLIGTSVIEQVLAHHRSWEEDEGLLLVYRGLIDSSGGTACQDAGGYSEQTLRRTIERRRAGQQISGFAAELGLTPRSGREAVTLALECRPCILLDTATGSDTASLTALALNNGAGAVLSNKAPLALPRTHPDGQVLWSEAVSGRRLRYETTCGAGLPVISTLRSLLDTGDRVIEIIGALSGTFGAIFSDIDAGAPFSQAVRSARDAGFTEPDPRDDLCGLDVARKALILARTIGMHSELAEIEIESLVPPELAAGSVDDFMDQVSAVDEPIKARSDAARANGARLRYVATVAPESPIVVGLRELPVDSVLGSLRGPENAVTIRTLRYDTHPINISGPGAGAAVTAAGVVADLLQLARLSGV